MVNTPVNEGSKNRLEQRLFVGIELVIVSVVIIFGVIFPTVVVLVIGWLSLYFRGKKWKDVGFKRPVSWSSIIGFGVFVSILIVVSLLMVILPILHVLTGATLDLSAFVGLKEGDYLALMGWLALTWTLAAFGEEFVYRGYLLNRWVELVGDERNGWIVAVVITSVLFGVGHAYQGIVGIITTTIIAVVYSAVYLWFKRNLWASIITHGLYDTITFIILFYFGEFLGILIL